jgi:hypothetical protein
MHLKIKTDKRNVWGSKRCSKNSLRTKISNYLLYGIEYNILYTHLEISKLYFVNIIYNKDERVLGGCMYKLLQKKKRNIMLHSQRVAKGYSDVLAEG